MTDLRSFRGAARPLDDLDLPRIGYRIRVGEDEVHAVMDVEAAGGAWDGQGRPKMLFEPHRFYKNLGVGSKRDQAIAAGYAYKSWGEQPYPRDSYPRLIEAMKIDETAALKSASWGLGQILGENFAMVGYASVQDMVLAFLDDADAHLDAMVSFIIAANLDDELRAHNWAAFARGYNGPQYAKNGYDTKLKAAYAKWARIRDTAWSPAGDLIRVPVPTPRPEASNTASTTPATIGHNGGPALSGSASTPLPANPSPTPVEQASKVVGGIKWAAIAGALWSSILAAEVLPPAFTTPEFSALVASAIGLIASAVGTYRAPQNATPVGTAP